MALASVCDKQLMADSCVMMLSTLFGASTWRWNVVKNKSQHTDIRPFVTWLLDVAELEIEREFIININDEDYQQSDAENCFTESVDCRDMSTDIEHEESEAIYPQYYYTEAMHTGYDDIDDDSGVTEPGSSVNEISEPTMKPELDKYDQDVLVAYEEESLQVENDDKGATKRDRLISHEKFISLLGENSGSTSQHVSIYTYKNFKKYSCSACKVMLSDVEMMNQHLEVCHRNCSVSIVCECCQKMFNSFKELVAYHKNCSTVKSSNTCSYCAKRCAGKQALTDHVKNIHENAAASYECQHCLKKFKYACNLTTHKKKCAK